jgi:PAS domain S-box-containing protein
MTQSQLSADHARHQLYEIMQEDLPFPEKARQALELGQSYLGVDNGHLTRIDQETDFWEAIASTDASDGDFPPGLVLDLQTTYCRRTIGSDSAIALDNAPEQGWADDPAFEAHELHCYMGAPLRVDGEIYGTVCFVSHNPRSEPFSDGETMFAELIARLLEHELEHSRQQAELDRRSALLDVLGRVLRHNLRNDMNVIRGRVQQLATEYDTATDQIAPLIRIIDDLFDLGEKARQFESVERSQGERQPLELRTLLERVVTNARSTYPTATLSIEGPEELSLTAKPSLSTAIQELVENAVEHSGDDPQVHVTIDSNEEAVQLSIADNGPGLPKHERDVLREGAETPLLHGSGLGLWLVHWIVSDHDGSLDFDVSEEGTTVQVRLPRGPGDSVTARKEDTTVALQRARDQFEAVFDESFDAMVITDDQGRYLEVNGAAVDLFATPYEDLLGAHIGDFTSDEFDFETAWAQFRNQGEQQGRFTLRRPDGTERIVEFSATANIVPGQHLSILRDITNRAAEQEELERKKRAMDAAPIGITISDPSQPDNPLIYANRRFEEITGYTAADIKGQNCRVLQGPETNPDQVGKIREAIADEESISVELTNYRNDGRPFENRVTIAPVYNETGELTNYVGFQEPLEPKE